MDANSSWDYRLDGAGRLWVAYYDQKRLLRLRDPEGRERLLVPEGRGQAPSGLALAALETGVGLLWRDKIPTKGLYLLDTELPEMQPLELGGDTQPLARILAEADREGMLHLLWYGEKANPSTRETYNLYYRHWNPSSQELSPIELLMPGIYPVMSTDAAGGVMVYSWSMNEKPQRILARYRPADAQASATAGGFGEPITVAEVPGITPIFDAFRSGSRWFVVWLSQYGADKRDYLLEGAHSDDNGKTWKHFAFEDLRRTDIASLQVATDDAGHILLAVSGSTGQGGTKSKEDVFIIRSDDRGDTWSPAERIRQEIGQDGKQGDQETNVLAGFHARNPSVAFGHGPGQVLVVWEDWRDIRSGLYASLSNDYGKTWSLSNVPLPQTPGKNLQLRRKLNVIHASDDRFQVIAEQPTNDSFELKDLVQLSFTAEELAGYALSARSIKPLDAKAREEGLRKHAEGFWQAMVAKDYEKTYAYFDPFFRARMAYFTYLSHMGRIQYTHAEVSGVRIDGSKAEVTTNIRASIPAFKVPSTGEIVSRPEQDVTAKSTWLWLDGDWHQEYKIESQETVFTRY